MGENQRSFRCKRLLPMPKKIQARKSAIHGNGVFSVAPIKQGERVIQYKGLLRSHGDVDADDSGDVESGHTSCSPSTTTG